MRLNGLGSMGLALWLLTLGQNTWHWAAVTECRSREQMPQP